MATSYERVLEAARRYPRDLRLQELPRDTSGRQHAQCSCLAHDGDSGPPLLLHKVRRTAAAKAESNLVAHTPPTAFDIHKEREPFFPQSFISGVKDQKRIPAKSVFQRIVDTASNSSGA